MKRTVRLINEKETKEVEITSFKEVLEYNKVYAIYPKTETVYYSEPFNVHLVGNTSVKINKIFSTIALVHQYPLAYLSRKSVDEDTFRDALELQFDLEEEGLTSDPLINQALDMNLTISFSAHPVNYINGIRIQDVRKATLLLAFCKLKRDDIIDKYQNLLNNTYCNIKQTKELVSIMEDIDGILA